MELKEYKEMPAALRRLIHESYSQVPTIKKVIVSANVPHEWMFGRMGVFMPETGSIVIDLAQTVLNTQWLQRGVFLTWNVWLNMLYVVMHEEAHAIRALHPELEEEWSLESLEAEVNAATIDNLLYYLETNPMMPNIKDMGWVKGMIQECINAFYPSNKALFNQEFGCLGTEAAANAVIAMRLLDTPCTEEEVRRLLDRMDEQKDMGVTIGGVKYLRAEEVIGLNF